MQNVFHRAMSPVDKLRRVGTPDGSAGRDLAHMDYLGPGRRAAHVVLPWRDPQAIGHLQMKQENDMESVSIAEAMSPRPFSPPPPGRVSRRSWGAWGPSRVPPQPETAHPSLGCRFKMTDTSCTNTSAHNVPRDLAPSSKPTVTPLSLPHPLCINPYTQKKNLFCFFKKRCRAE